MNYQSLTPELIEQFRGICGADALMNADDPKAARYGRDQVSEKAYHHPPDLVVFPTTKEQVSQILELADRARIPVTPRGAGSGLSGGAVPACGGIVLSLERMNKILEIDPESLCAVVQPGVVTAALDRELEPYGLFFAGYPISEDFCHIGGNIAENAGGGRAVKYGVTGNYVTGLEIVIPGGEVLRLGGKRYKDVTGYDLISLIVGSEGTLAVVTEITLRLSPRPRHRRSLLTGFGRESEAIDTVSAIFRDTGIVPTSIEFMDAFCFTETAKSLRFDLPSEGSAAYMLYEVDGADPNDTERGIEKINDAVRGSSPMFSELLSDSRSEEVWKLRKRIPWMLKRITPHQSAEDISVPIGAIPGFVRRLRSIESDLGIHIPVFGHAGDGNLHAHPMAVGDEAEDRWAEIRKPVLTTLYEEALRLGGTISGEHGIGNKRREFMPLVSSPTELGLLKGIKGVFDPNAILNPAKIF
jgi:glycolate oxidase